MARIVFIYNPVSGRADSRAREVAAAVLGGSGRRVDVVATERSGHATELARRAVDEEVDAVVVNGGDGTIAEVVEGILGSDVPLGILPRGTANQLARNLGIPSAGERAARVVVAGHTRRIDVGEWRAGDARACFTVACGVGFDAEIMRATSPELKRAGGMMAYATQAVTLARKLVPYSFRITVDGDLEETDAATVLIANCPRVIPPFRPLRRGIAVDDGVLDVVSLRATGLREALSVWFTLARVKDDSERIRHLRGLEITVESGTPAAAECDGNLVGSTPFTVRLLPSALAVFVPGRDSFHPRGGVS